MSTSGKPSRKRGEARQATLDAARDLFSTAGYQGTSIRDIAAAAQVSEALVFRNFGTKDQLFAEAVSEPYRDFLIDFGRRWDQLPEPASNEEMIKRFVTELYAFVREHRDLLFTLVVASRFHANAAQAETHASALSRQIRELASKTTREAGWRGLEHVDHELAASFTVAMIFAVVLLDDVLLGSGLPDRTPEQLLDALTAYTTAGILQKP